MGIPTYCAYSNNHKSFYDTHSPTVKSPTERRDHDGRSNIETFN